MKQIAISLTHHNPLRDLSSLVAIALLIIPVWGLGQDVDSLESALVSATGKERVDILHQLCRTYTATNPALALERGREGYSLAIELSDSTGICLAGRAYGIALRENGELEMATKILNHAVMIARRIEFTKLDEILNSCGNLYLLRADYDVGLDLLLESLYLRQNSKDTAKIAIVLNNIGFTYYKLHNFSKALEYYRQSLSYKERMRDDWDRDILFANLALCHAQRHEYDSAEYYLVRALKAWESNRLPGPWVQIEFANAFLAYKKRNYDNAMVHFFRADSVATRLGYHRFRLDILCNIARIHMALGSLQEAYRTLEIAQSLAEASPLHHTERLEVYRLLMDVFSTDTRNSIRLAKYQRLYIRLKDSIFNARLTNNLMKIEADAQQRENLAIITRQEQALSFKEQLLGKQRVINVLTGGLFVLTGSLAICLYHMLRKRQHINNLLNQKVQDRTRELRESHARLSKEMRMRELELERQKAEIRSKLNTALGLANLVDTGGQGLSNLSNDANLSLKSIIESLIKDVEEQKRLHLR